MSVKKNKALIENYSEFLSTELKLSGHTLQQYVSHYKTILFLVFQLTDNLIFKDSKYDGVNPVIFKHVEKQLRDIIEIINLSIIKRNVSMPQHLNSKSCVNARHKEQTKK